MVKAVLEREFSVTEEIPMETKGAETRAKGRSGRFAAFVILAVALAGAAIGGIATKAFAQGDFGWGGPPFMRHGGMMGGGMMQGGPMDPAEMARHIERRVKHFCVDIDCTPDQQGKLIDIAQNLAKDVGPVRQEMRRTREQVMDLLAAPTIDRNALEQVRAQRVQRIDEISKRVTQALADAAEVLTPEQRTEAVKRFEQMRERRGRWFHQRG